MLGIMIFTVTWVYCNSLSTSIDVHRRSFSRFHTGRRDRPTRAEQTGYAFAYASNGRLVCIDVGCIVEPDASNGTKQSFSRNQMSLSVSVIEWIRSDPMRFVAVVAGGSRHTHTRVANMISVPIATRFSSSAGSLIRWHPTSF